MSNKFDRLITLLKELFQLDQPDLDFGLYRIMHAKSGEITQFLETDLLPQVRQAFEQYQPADKAAISQKLEKAVAAAESLGVDPETNEKVQELKTDLEAGVDLAVLEGEVYDHLYSFFRRYYSDGDFLAKRVYKQGVYAIPYEGEEVVLHWANKDQYYIKTSEYLRDYAFRLKPENETNPMRVHFRLMDVAEGEHGNIKATEGKNRVFILAPAGESGRDFISVETIDGRDELVIAFEYRPATLDDWTEETLESSSVAAQKKPPIQKNLISIAVQAVLDVGADDLTSWINELGKRHVKVNGETADYSRLQGHLTRYTARHTFDYFIHKDLGGFLRRELDFYIKNEVMHLDDIENETAPKVEQYLSQIKVIRSIAGKIIDFLAQLEDFQKKMWLKKKFVTETNYCITLDLIPEDSYPEIATNEAQREEWVKLFAINEIEGDMHSPAYSEPLTVEFLKANDKLVIDTRFYDDSFKVMMTNSIENLDEQCGGLLVHSENYQALNLAQKCFRKRIKCIHIDPPYNTSSSGFLYKNEYQHYSWLSLMHDRIDAGFDYLKDRGVFSCHIDEYEMENLQILFDYFRLINAGTLVWDKGMPIAGSNGLATQHEYVLFRTRGNTSIRVKKRNIEKVKRKARELISKYQTPTKAAHYEYRRWLRSQTSFSKSELTFDQIDENGMVFRSDNMSATDRRTNKKFYIPLRHPSNGKYCTVPKYGWRYTPDSIENLHKQGLILFGKNHTIMPRKKTYLESTLDSQMSTIYQSGSRGKRNLDELSLEFPFAHSTEYYSHIIDSAVDSEDLILDYFAGSGTTGHAVINLNREDGGKRKYILVEMGDYFSTVLKPRIAKVVYSEKWKDGKPVSRSTGISHCIKYIRLESYEDALNNLQIERDETQDGLLTSPEARAIAEQYMLRYMLDVETQGSQSLLNVQAFTDPTAYKLVVKRPGSDESRETNVDLLETFNWLIGLRVGHIAAPKTFSAEFERDDEGRLKFAGGRGSRLRPDDNGPWWFRTVTGTTPDGKRALIIWRKRPGGDTPEGIEQDNLVLDEWFRKQEYSTTDSEFDLIYVNGDNNLANLRQAEAEDTGLVETGWKLRVIEEDFHRLMFETEGA